MTYLQFHLTFLVPVIAVLAWLVIKRNAHPFPRPTLATAALCLIAFVYTTPWDNYLVFREVWTYETGRVLESLRIGYVPAEEYLFFLLQPILTSLFLLFFAGRKIDVVEKAGRDRSRHHYLRILTGLLFLLLTALGIGLLVAAGESFLYLGLILSWACPVLSFQSFFGADRILLYRRIFLPALVGSTAYLWLIDGIAIGWEIWQITPATSTGWKLMALPVEEAIFFLLTNLLVLNGLILFYDLLIQRRGRSL